MEAENKRGRRGRDVHPGKAYMTLRMGTPGKRRGAGAKHKGESSVIKAECRRLRNEKCGGTSVYKGEEI